MAERNKGLSDKYRYYLSDQAEENKDQSDKYKYHLSDQARFSREELRKQAEYRKGATGRTIKGEEDVRMKEKKLLERERRERIQTQRKYEELMKYSEDKQKDAERNWRKADSAKMIGQQERTNVERMVKEQTTKHLLVGAIDFGTTYSGWACSFIDEYKSDPTKASVRQWYSGSGSLSTEKTPTCVLVRPDGKTLEAFGYEAENKYKELVDVEEHKGYYYFKKFKMMLNKKLGENIERSFTLEDEMGRSLPALDVFAMAIKYLKDDMLFTIKDRLTGVLQDTDVHWVLTVPAIWTDGAKQFMREAANKAGITGKQLTIALEPEAASLYCRNISVETIVDQSCVSLAKLKAGTKYMILDAGGGTIDLTVHEVEKSGGVKEVHAACGGGCGGTIVDKAFKNMLVDLFTRQVYEKFKLEETEDWLDLWRDFEVKKRAVSPTKSARINMKFPVSLIDMFKKETGSSLSDALSNSKYGDDISFSGDKMKFSADIFKSLFETSVEKTIGFAKGVIRDTQVAAVLMVGGFSESPMLQQAVKSNFSGVDVVIPKDASSAILRGALIYGHNPKSITERILKYTYGIDTVSFKEGIHPESKRFKSAKGYCCDIFDKHVEKNQLVKVGEPQVKRSYMPLYKTQTSLDFLIYASELKNPQHIDQECTLVGSMNVELIGHDGDLQREVQVSLTFSGTEIVVNAIDEKSGIESNATIDFLG